MSEKSSMGQAGGDEARSIREACGGINFYLWQVIKFCIHQERIRAAAALAAEEFKRLREATEQANERAREFARSMDRAAGGQGGDAT